MRIFVLSCCLLVVGCGHQAPANDPHRQELLVKFRKTILPQIEDSIATLVEFGHKPTWEEGAKFGMQDSANPYSPGEPYTKGERVLVTGQFEDGTKVIAESYYSKRREGWESVTIIIDWPLRGKPAPRGNIPITAQYLKAHHVRPDLATELMSGIGKGSMSGTTPSDFQARIEWKEKIVDVTTAVQRGEPLSLELQCGFFLMK